MKSELSLELNEKLKGDYLFNDIEMFTRNFLLTKRENDLKNNDTSNQISKKIQVILMY